MQAPAGPLDEIYATGEARILARAEAEAAIGAVATATADLEAEYETGLRTLEGLTQYNDLLAERIAYQANELEELEQGISDIADVERSIVPLMQRMVATLGDLVRLDAPFLRRERRERVQRLDRLLKRSDVSVAEQFRNILEAYSIEMEYGRTIERYRDTLRGSNEPRSVEVLRIGRVALLYRALDDSEYGRWDRVSRAWQSIDAVAYGEAIRRGLKVARRQAPPDLITVPVGPVQRRD